MNEHHYQRIDKGISRSEAKQMRQEARQQPRSPEGTYLPICTTERRSEIILDALQAIKQGEPTDQIAARHGIAGRTLRSWLISLPEADQARSEFLANELAYYLEEIELATEPMPLARAREGFRAWAWIAERREARLFGQKQEITHLNVDLGDRLRRARERVIDQADTDKLPHSGVMSNAAESKPKDPTGSM